MFFDPFKHFELAKPISGFVYHIISPKGIKKEDGGTTIYRFRYADYPDIYSGEPIDLDDGLYYLLDICHKGNDVVWNHYLIVAGWDDAYIVGEYLACPDTLWMKKAMKVVKRYFSGETLEPIEHTRWAKEKSKNVDWSTIPQSKK